MEQLGQYYGKILQILPAAPGWDAVHIDDAKDDLHDKSPIVCWALVERIGESEVQWRMMAPLPARTTVVALIPASPSDDNPNELTVCRGDDDYFLGYTYPGDPTNWEHEASSRLDAIAARQGETLQKEGGQE
jgi:hypothetical protein